MAVRMKPPARADRALPVWQTALLTQGCEVHAEGDVFPLELRPVGDSIVCTPAVSGWIAPFQLKVTVGEPVTITWDQELSRYVVTASGRHRAA
jgi:hypothetical protein